MWITALLWSLPWAAWLAYVVVVVRDPPPLPSAVGPSRSAPANEGGTRHAGTVLVPSVSVIVPARDEAHNVGRCVASLVASDHPDFEVIVVDDRSVDGTGGIARRVGAGRARRLVVLDGTEVPEGWFGKQWACWQGAQAARGDLLLFTDADTVHAPALLGRAVAGLQAEQADCVTVMGRQIMGSFWERVVQPQIFFMLALRYPRLGRAPLPRPRWRSAIANGQFLLFERGAYERLGGHAAVRYEAAEDLRLAQRLVRGGGRLVVRSALEDFGTRMYRGLGELAAGWSKNMMPAGLQTLPPWLRPLAPPAMLVGGLAVWLAPPAALASLAVLVLAGRPSDPVVAAWSALTSALLAVFWVGACRRFGAPAWAGLLYPLGAAVALGILVRSWFGRRRVSWKGRSYAWDVYSDVEPRTPS